jgi:hypothetical protein
MAAKLSTESSLWRPGNYPVPQVRAPSYDVRGFHFSGFWSAHLGRGFLKPSENLELFGNPRLARLRQRGTLRLRSGQALGTRRVRMVQPQPAKFLPGWPFQRGRAARYHRGVLRLQDPRRRGLYLRLSPRLVQPASGGRAEVNPLSDVRCPRASRPLHIFLCRFLNLPVVTLREEINAS